MGRTLISGPESEVFLNYVTTNNVTRLTPLSAQYSTMCNQKGGIKDDFVLSKLEADEFFMVYNAANRRKNYEWLVQHSGSFNVETEDVSDIIAMFAVQGPKAQQTLQKIADSDLNQIERFKCGWTKLAGVNVFLSRTGYTGEDGFEIYIWDTPISNPTKAKKAWNAILEAGKDFGIEPCGLGARDTLRLEAGMCLYGNDIEENTTPLEARLSFVVKFKKENFIGKDALLKQKTQGIEKKRVGLRLKGKGIPRPNYEVWKNSQKIGHITSGTFSPVLQRGIAMAYVPTEHAAEASQVMVKIRDKHVKADVVKLPFYDPTKYGYRRKSATS
jgi:aminomethyltransferase